MTESTPSSGAVNIHVCEMSWSDRARFSESNINIFASTVLAISLVLLSTSCGNDGGSLLR